MPMEYPRFTATETERMVDFLIEESWPYHGPLENSPATWRRLVAEGYFDDEATQTFWIIADGNPVGMLRVWDLTDDTPMFDIRIRTAHRGHGIGTQALGWLTGHLFTEFPNVARIEGTTRQDNLGMRKVFHRCGYVKESHYREAWAGRNGTKYDAIGYAVLRRDWAADTVTPVNWDDEPSD